jgi:hypothetical protein
MRLMCLLVLCLMAVSAGATELWRWVDDNGVVHYSDRPVPGAEKVIIKGAQTFSVPAVPDSAASSEDASAEDEPENGERASYRRFAITQPAREETFWNIEGRLNVSIDVDPAIRGQHALKLYLDGQPVEGVPPAGTSFTVGNVFRGDHTLRASIVDQRGRELVSSQPVRFFVRQTSQLNPNNPATRPPSGPRPTPLPARPGGG